MRVLAVGLFLLACQAAAPAPSSTPAPSLSPSALVFSVGGTQARYVATVMAFGATKVVFTPDGARIVAVRERLLAADIGA